MALWMVVGFTRSDGIERSRAWLSAAMSKFCGCLAPARVAVPDMRGINGEVRGAIKPEHMEVSEPVSCPFCGETFDLTIDTSVARQSFVTDCEVCCRPFTVAVECEP